MKCHNKLILFVLALMLQFPAVSLAEAVHVNATGEYIMGDNDTFTEGKKLALQDAKRLVLEKVGTYIESVTEVKNGAVSSDEIKQYTAGIIKIDVTDEKRSILENKATVVTVTVSAVVNPDEVVRQVLSLQKRKEVEEKARRLSTENERLRKEIVVMNQQLRTITDTKRNRELREQRDVALQKILDNEKGLTILVSGESLVKASLFDQQKKKDDRQLVRRFLHEVADAYQIKSEDPEVEDNGDGTSNVIIRYSMQLPGSFDLKRSSIDVSSINEFLSRGFVIKAFSNGGLIIRCADYGRSKCNTILSPFFDEEVLKMHVMVRLGQYKQVESISIMESSDPSKRKPAVAAPRNTTERYRHIDTWRPKWEPPRTEASYWQKEEKNPTFQNPDPKRILYPVVYRGSYACEFKRIPYSELQKVSRIEIKVVHE